MTQELNTNSIELPAEMAIPTQLGAKTYWEVDREVQVGVVNGGVYLQLSGALLPADAPVDWTRSLMRQILSHNGSILGSITKDPETQEVVIIANLKHPLKKAELENMTSRFTAGYYHLLNQVKLLRQPLRKQP